MTAVDPPPLTPALLEVYLHRIDVLVHRFPDGEDQDDDVSGTRDYHWLRLRSSRDFWEDRDTDSWHAAHDDIDSARAALGEMLARRWGPARHLDPGHYLFPDHAPVAEVLSFLASWSGIAHVWLLPGTEYFLALAICQADTEYPLELTAIVGFAADVDDALDRSNV